MSEDIRHQASDSEMRGRSGAESTSELARLAKLHGYTVAEGDPDIRGWDVRTVDGWKFGEVEDLIVDTAAMRVRYLVVRIGKELLAGDADRRLFVPLGTARLDDEGDNVIVERVPIDGFAGFLTSRDYLTSDDERSLHRAYGYGQPGTPNAEVFGRALYDDRGFWGRRRQGGEDVPYIVRSPRGAERR